MTTDQHGLRGLPSAPRVRAADVHARGTNSFAVAAFKRDGEDGGGLALAGLVLAYSQVVFWVSMIIIVRSS